MISGRVPAAFLSTLCTERYDKPDSGKWILTKPFSFYSEFLGKIITVPKGFITDFASVPRLPVVYWLTGDTCDEAAVIHDYLYTTHLTTRAVADHVLYEASRVMGEPAWRCALMWAGVRVGGGGSDHWGKGVQA